MLTMQKHTHIHVCTYAHPLPISSYGYFKFKLRIKDFFNVTPFILYLCLLVRILFLKDTINDEIFHNYTFALFIYTHSHLRITLLIPLPTIYQKELTFSLNILSPIFLHFHTCIILIFPEYINITTNTLSF